MGRREQMQPELVTALGMFNGVIPREAIEHGVPVLGLLLKDRSPLRIQQSVKRQVLNAGKPPL